MRPPFCARRAPFALPYRIFLSALASQHERGRSHNNNSARSSRIAEPEFALLLQILLHCTYDHHPHDSFLCSTAVSEAGVSFAPVQNLCEILPSLSDPLPDLRLHGAVSRSHGIRYHLPTIGSLHQLRQQPGGGTGPATKSARSRDPLPPRGGHGPVPGRIWRVPHGCQARTEAATIDWRRGAV